MITTVPGQASYDLGVEIGKVLFAKMDAGYAHYLHAKPMLGVFTPSQPGLPTHYEIKGSVLTLFPPPLAVWDLDILFYPAPVYAVWPVATEAEPPAAEPPAAEPPAAEPPAAEPPAAEPPASLSILAPGSLDSTDTTFRPVADPDLDDPAKPPA